MNVCVCVSAGYLSWLSTMGLLGMWAGAEWNRVSIVIPVAVRCCRISTGNLGSGVPTPNGRVSGNGYMGNGQIGV